MIIYKYQKVSKTLCILCKYVIGNKMLTKLKYLNKIIPLLYCMFIALL